MRAQSQSTASSEKLHRLWQAYRSAGDLRIRDRLVLTLSPLVSFAFPQRAPHDEASLSNAFGVLVGAIERWDPSRDGELDQFAWDELSRVAAGSLAAA